MHLSRLLEISRQFRTIGNPDGSGNMHASESGKAIDLRSQVQSTQVQLKPAIYFFPCPGVVLYRLGIFG